MKTIELDINVDDKLRPEYFTDKLTALEENEMELFRFLLRKPAGVILTAETDKMLAQILSDAGLIWMDDGEKVIVPEDIREAYDRIWCDELTLRWRKRNWMYKCIEAGKTLYGVMTWQALKDLFALRYPHAEMDEIRELFNSTPAFNQWFTERDGKLVLNGFERDDYYKYLEQEVQRDVPFYVPTREEVEEIYENGCLISREAHARLRDFIAETWGCGKDTASIRMSELYDYVNNRVRINEVADRFAAGGESGQAFPFESDEIQYRFLELFMEMSRECRIRDNRGHDWYEMAAIMAMQGRNKADKDPQIRRAKVGRNDPCPCGSGKKYKNCCGSPLRS